MSANIKVAVRVRPLTTDEKDNGMESGYVQLDRKNKIITIDQGTNGQNKQYSFDCILGDKSKQEDVYKNCGIGYLVKKAVEGYNSSIFVYGQTGSGKTYTMQGEDVKQVGDGLISRVTHALYRQIQNNSQSVVSVSVSYLQIYSQKIYDLLNPTLSKGGLKLRWTKQDQFTVQNLFVFQCLSAEELLEHVRKGLSNRVTASHKLNLNSSRSHTILTIRINIFDRQNPDCIKSSRIDLIDLAGSQRTVQTGSEGKMAKESIDINKSLFSLKQVINVLAEGKSQYVPYRDSKLTSLLKQTIGGNCYCLMIACLTPINQYAQENISTLAYATKAAQIVNQPTVNLNPYEKKIQALEQRLTVVNKQLQNATKNTKIVQRITSQGFDSIIEKAGGVLDRVSQNMDKTSTSGFNKNRELLLETVEMVRDLLKNNKQLRDRLQQQQNLIDKKNLEIFQLYRENESLKHQVDNSSLKVTKKTFFKFGGATARLNVEKEHALTKYPSQDSKKLFVPILSKIDKHRNQNRLNTYSSFAESKQIISEEITDKKATNSFFNTTRLKTIRSKTQSSEHKDVKKSYEKTFRYDIRLVTQT